MLRGTACAEMHCHNGAFVEFIPAADKNPAVTHIPKEGIEILCPVEIGVFDRHVFRTIPTLMAAVFPKSGHGSLLNRLHRTTRSQTAH
jgi:hypothetical protein